MSEVIPQMLSNPLETDEDLFPSWLRIARTCTKQMFLNRLSVEGRDFC